MSGSNRNRQSKEDASVLEIPRETWGKFLETFSRQHHGWPIQLETHDLVTAEKVLSQETTLKCVELDLEDEKNPRINVIVQLDNKVIKHILFLPSRLVLESLQDARGNRLRIETLNTETTLHFRAPAPFPSA
jgi:Family of unknown function (DUF5335)